MRGRWRRRASGERERGEESERRDRIRIRIKGVDTSRDLADLADRYYSRFFLHFFFFFEEGENALRIPRLFVVGVMWDSPSIT